MPHRHPQYETPPLLGAFFVVVVVAMVAAVAGLVLPVFVVFVEAHAENPAATTSTRPTPRTLVRTSSRVSAMSILFSGDLAHAPS